MYTKFEINDKRMILRFCHVVVNKDLTAVFLFLIKILNFQLIKCAHLMNKYF